jgi:hypothetical protein
MIETMASCEVMHACDCCKRKVDYLRGSMWHGEDRICRECFGEWYDESRPTARTDESDKRAIGDWVRKRHGLSALTQAEEKSAW